ncbi:glutathione S-transferase family protein [Ferruginivarius sediminum]|uniref:Glutathione S-transferase family protein n=1 Tax=Ferruginivarius sediminum TaxID=2661937 RepID=A0A369TBW8_9PROT|nr:glutathione S-transferase family protein [Ferruginivarius sediminum]RDD62841.1 glutathione S-transferase family protein [Ferruginivarius sediminum]
MLQVYGRENSVNVQKVMWTVGELGLAHHRHDVGRGFGGNDQPWFLALNPNGTVPTIDDEGTVVWESNAIVRYLAARYAAGTLWPQDPAARAAADIWMDWQQTAVNPAIHPVFWNLIRTPEAQRDMAVVEAGREKLDRLFGILDRHLADRRYIAGDSFTMGDIPLGAMTYRWLHLPMEREEAPNVSAWHDRLAERSAFREHVMLPLT